MSISLLLLKVKDKTKERALIKRRRLVGLENHDHIRRMYASNVVKVETLRKIVLCKKKRLSLVRYKVRGIKKVVKTKKRTEEGLLNQVLSQVWRKGAFLEGLSKKVTTRS